MKRIVATGAVAALAMVGFAGTASAEPMGKGYGKEIQTDFGANYGQLLNSVRDGHPDPDGGQDAIQVFPPASGAKAFYENHPRG